MMKTQNENDRIIGFGHIETMVNTIFHVNDISIQQTHIDKCKLNNQILKPTNIQYLCSRINQIYYILWIW